MKKKHLKKDLKRLRGDLTFLARRFDAADQRARNAEQLLTELIHHIGVDNIPNDLGNRYLTIKRSREDEDAIWNRVLLRMKGGPNASC